MVMALEPASTSADANRGPVADVTAIVLTRDEERNLAACLESLSGWTARVIVVDSGSTDRTLAIARAAGADIVEHAFETHARQWKWVLEHIPVDTPWVLGLDADQHVTPELRQSIERVTGSPEVSGPAGYFIARRQVFRGRWIRHGGYYPKYLLKLFRREAVRVDEQDLVDHHFVVHGAVGRLDGDLIEDNRNEAAIAVWTDKHNRYAVRQARQEFEAARRLPPLSFAGMWQSPDTRTAVMKQIWARLPLFIRPCLYVTYRYVIRLGFLDGKEGFIFHVLQAFWYRLLVDINLDELRRDSPVP
jgi:glycosyltransferase involved in cell wall biosynthesis